RMAVISFHSLEDRRVKKAWNALAKPPAASRRDPVALDFKPTLKLVGKPISADEAECQANPRSRSARLRVAERLMAEAA
ncbi:MAG TPA: 16S rRNA (cytosine(1402)-N(4))-methyltransferase, partial [Wenzhouxiangella sp.]